MEWDNEKDKEALLAFKDNIDSDDVRVKETIKKVLLNNRFIVHVLNNKKLEEADSEPDDYYGINIKPYYLIPDTQTESLNYLCFEVNYDELDRYNSCVKKLEVVFHILCYHLDIIDDETGIARHDLLAALIQDQFNFSTYIGGGRLRLVSDVASTTDKQYATRTLTFVQQTDNNVVKTRNGVPRMLNKEMMNSEI